MTARPECAYEPCSAASASTTSPASSSPATGTSRGTGASGTHTLATGVATRRTSTWSYRRTKRPSGAGEHVRVVGDEWGTPEDVEHVEDFVYPYLERDARVAEIGIGGGRIAARVAPRVGELWGFDISRGMLRRAREALAHHSNVRLVLLKDVVERRSEVDASNFYYARDYIALLAKGR